MLIVCHETAEQKARARAEKEGKVKELLKQYQDIKADHDMLFSLATKWQGISDEMTIHEALKCLGNHLYDTSGEIVDKLQQELDAAGGYKPLWAVVPVDADDDCWRRNRGAFKQLRYYMFTNRQDAEDHKSDGFKVVPVWGE